jgi:hypothetical protein
MNQMSIWTAIAEMRKLTGLGIPFSFEHATGNRVRQTSLMPARNKKRLSHKYTFYPNGHVEPVFRRNAFGRNIIGLRNYTHFDKRSTELTPKAQCDLIF